MKKRLILCCSLFMLGAGLVACNQGSSSNSNTTETQVQEESVEESTTYQELEAELKNQPVYVESTEYIVQDEQYKALYPDILSAVVKNNSGTDVKNVQVAFAAWDSNNFPVKITPRFNYNNVDYVVLCDYGDVNMVDGATFGENYGLELDPETQAISKIKAIVVNYTDFEGNTWENLCYEDWAALYENKKLEE